MLPNAYGLHPSNFRAPHAFPEQIMLVWGGGRQLFLERSEDGGENWLDLGRTETENHFFDTDIVEGASYNYRGRLHPTHPWTYLDTTAPPPGGAAAVPLWLAPRIIPQLDGVTWECPNAAVRNFCVGTLHMRLQGEPGTGSLAGATLRVFLNEETFELHDGAGEEIHTEFNVSNNYLLAFRGYDLPACVVRKAQPDAEVTVPAGAEEIGVDLSGVIFGANGLRFEVETPTGDISERALLILVLDEPVQDDSRVQYDHFVPVLFGDVLVDNDPTISGFGPAGRHLSLIHI